MSEAEELERVSQSETGARQLWYPFAHLDCARSPVKGKYRKGYPEGCVVHFTAGRSHQGAVNAKQAIDWGSANGFSYFAIGNDGSVYQPAPLDSWGHHAGKSSWPGYEKGVSAYFVGIEVCCAGRLTKKPDGFYTWYGEKIESNQVRYQLENENIETGYYHKYTEAQEQALIDLIVWLKFNNPDVFDLDKVVAHSEVSPGRKNDPGASLGWTMPHFRKVVKEKYSQFMSSKI